METRVSVLQAYAGFMESRARYAVLYGGAGSGKSVAAAQKVVLRCLEAPGIKILVVRKTERSLRASVFAQLEAVLREGGILDSVRRKRTRGDLWMGFANGSEVLFAGCYDAERLKSIQGVSGVWVEEATELSAEDFRQLDLRVRGVTEGYHQLVLTFNPVDQGHWIYGRFFEAQPQPQPLPYREGGLGARGKGNATNHPALRAPLRSLSSHSRARESVKKEGSSRSRSRTKVASEPHPLAPSPIGRGNEDVFVLRTTYADNRWLGDAYVRLLEETLRADANMYRVYALGQWGHLKRGGEFYKQFSMARHVGSTKYDKDLPLHISFDFNLNPYITLTVWQAEKVKSRKGDVMDLRQIDELCLSNPDNTTPALCQAFLDTYGRHTAGLSIYGDPTGARGNTQTTDRQSDYYVIKRELKQLNPAMKVSASAPSVAQRGQFINQVLLGSIQNIAIRISPACLNTIADYQNLQEDSDGSKIKEMHTDKNGIRSQKYGHCSDANDYLLCKLLEAGFRAFKRRPGLPAKPIIGYDDSSRWGP